jgi:hypothetical protein
MLPAAGEGLQFAGHGGDDGDSGLDLPRLPHQGAYPWARNHSMAERMAG